MTVYSISSNYYACSSYSFSDLEWKVSSAVFLVMSVMSTASFLPLTSVVYYVPLTVSYYGFAMLGFS